MADFTTNLTGTAQIDDSIVLAYDQQFLVTVGQNQVMEQVSTINVDINAKSIQMTKYGRLGLATTPLSEREDLVSEAISDSNIIIQPQEYGNVVTTTALASIQSGGKLDLAVPTLVGLNASMTQDKLACLALDASSNGFIVSGKAAGDVLATDVANRAFFNKAYNLLARNNVPSFENGLYVAIMHDDVIADLRESAESGSWLDVSKYASNIPTMTNEIGSFCGFRIIRNNHATFGDQTGAGTVDLYNVYFLGQNGLGKAVSKAPSYVITPPSDKLGRFVHHGWYGVLKYQIVDQDAVYVGKVASSKGANAV